MNPMNNDLPDIAADIVVLPPTDIAVIIGRFQTSALTNGHKSLLDFPAERGIKRMIVFLGVTQIGPSKNDPLDFETRERMLADYFTQYDSLFDGVAWTILPLPDHKDDAVWASQIDNTVRCLAGNGAKPFKVTVFGGRDSAISTYASNGGRYQTFTIPTVPKVSATEARCKIGASLPLSTEDFRQGVIYATQKQYPISFSTVDIAVFKPLYDETQTFAGFELVLGTKNDGQGLRLPGGFVDPSDATLEQAAAREMVEELGVNLVAAVPKYVTSLRLNDWRYRSQQDKILTTLFAFEYKWGNIIAGDDLDTADWYTFKMEGRHLINPPEVATNHAKLVQTLSQYIFDHYRQPTNNDSPTVNIHV